MKQVQLDQKALLGFKILPSTDKTATGIQIGAKIGGGEKVGGKNSGGVNGV